MENSYIEKRNGGYFVKGTRVSVDSVVYAFLDGYSPETIVRDCYPVLTLEQVYGVIAHYLGHRVEIDEYLREGERLYETLREDSRKKYPELTRKLTEARRKAELSRK